MQAGKTALYLASEEGYYECVEVLLEAGCDVNIVTKVSVNISHFLGRLQSCRVVVGFGYPILTCYYLSLHLPVPGAALSLSGASNTKCWDCTAPPTRHGWQSSNLIAME